MHLLRPMVEAVRRQALARGIPYQRLVRKAIQEALHYRRAG
jgi:predicted DNA binding CopG/RHH family protein